MPRDAKATARRSNYVVPADAQWTEVPDEGSTDKARYAHEIGRRWQTFVKCPDCGDTVKVSTDQNPAEQSTWDVEAERARAEQEAANAAQPTSEA